MVPRNDFSDPIFRRYGLEHLFDNKVLYLQYKKQDMPNHFEIISKE